MRSAEKNRFTGAGQNIINQRDRLLNLQKRQKLKDLLITKFMQKYGIKNPEKLLEEEITKFLQGEKLNRAQVTTTKTTTTISGGQDNSGRRSYTRLGSQNT